MHCTCRSSVWLKTAQMSSYFFSQTLQSVSIATKQSQLALHASSNLQRYFTSCLAHLLWAWPASAPALKTNSWLTWMCCLLGAGGRRFLALLRDGDGAIRTRHVAHQPWLCSARERLSTAVSQPWACIRCSGPVEIRYCTRGERGGEGTQMELLYCRASLLGT